MSRGGAAYRPETPRHTRGNWLTKSRFAERYPQDAAPTAAGGQQAHRPGLRKSRATGLRPADRPTLVSITRGFGSRLAAAALEDARRQGLEVVPLCPFVAHYIESRPEFDDLVASDYRDRPAKPRP